MILHREVQVIRKCNKIKRDKAGQSIPNSLNISVRDLCKPIFKACLQQRQNKGKERMFRY